MKTIFLSIIYEVSNEPFDSDTFLKKIFPNFWDFVVQFLAFIILLVIVIFLGYKPIKKLLDERKKYVDENLNGSLKAKEEALKSKDLAEKEISLGKNKASQIVEEAKVEALKEREKILEEAKSDAIKEKEKAQEEIALAKKSAKESIKKEIVDVAIQASTQLLGREVNKDDNEKLLNDFVDSISKGK